MFCNEEKMRVEVRNNGGFVRRMLGGKTREQARDLLQEEYERTLRNYCRVLQVERISTLRKNGLIDAIINFADEHGFLADVVSREEDNSAYFGDISAVEADIQDKMMAIQANYKYLGYVTSLMKSATELKAEALTTYEEIRGLLATCENYSIVPATENKPQQVQPLRIEPLNLASDDMPSEIVKVCHNWYIFLNCKTREDIRHLVWGGALGY